MGRKNLTEEEMLELIKLLKEGQGSEKEASKWIDSLEDSGLTEVSDLIFWDKRNLSPEEILKEAKEKSKPITL